MENKIKITMLMANLGYTGTPRLMMDVVENINHKIFDVHVAYKSDFHGIGNDLLNDLKELGVNVVPLRGKRLFSFNSIIDLYMHIRKDSIQIIHCWDSLGIIARFLKIFKKFKLIQTYCNPSIDRGSFLFFWINKISSLFTDSIVFCTKGVQDDYINKKIVFLKNKYIKIITNCINCNEIKDHSFNQEEIKKRMNINRDDFILTNIGYFNEQKGQKYLLRSIELLKNEIKNIKLVLVGWGLLESELKNEVRELEIEDNVIFAGKCDRKSVFDILSITDIFVLSSLWEGFGLVLAEAMAFGKPVVSTINVGSEVVVKENETGLLVPVKDVKAFSDAILSLAQNPEKRNKFGKQGIKRVESNFSVGTYINSYTELYEFIISK